MQLTYDDKRITIDDNLLSGLEQYARDVLLKMQQANPEFADCWTGCQITFNSLQPEFMYGSIEDMDEDDGIVVSMPLDG